MITLCAADVDNHFLFSTLTPRHRSLKSRPLHGCVTIVILTAGAQGCIISILSHCKL